MGYLGIMEATAEHLKSKLWGIWAVYALKLNNRLLPKSSRFLWVRIIQQQGLKGQSLDFFTQNLFADGWQQVSLLKRQGLWKSNNERVFALPPLLWAYLSMLKRSGFRLLLHIRYVYMYVGLILCFDWCFALLFFVVFYLVHCYFNLLTN